MSERRKSSDDLRTETISSSLPNLWASMRTSAAVLGKVNSRRGFRFRLRLESSPRTFFDPKTSLLASQLLGRCHGLDAATSATCFLFANSKFGLENSYTVTSIPYSTLNESSLSRLNATFDMCFRFIRTRSPNRFVLSSFESQTDEFCPQSQQKAWKRNNSGSNVGSDGFWGFAGA